MKHFIKVFSLVISLIVLSACSGGDSDNSGGDDPLTITATNPNYNETGIPLDQMIAISFSEALDINSVDENSIVLESNGLKVMGQSTVNKQTILFIVPTLKQDTEYTVTVNRLIQSLDGSTLNSNQTFSFTTGQTYADGSSPLNESFKPFGSSQFVTLIGKKEYMLLGLDDVSNVQLIDPLEFNSDEPPVDPNDDVLYKDTNTDLITTNKKRAVSGSLDSDFYEEVAVISWPDTGEGKLSIYDHDEGSQYGTAVDVSLEIDSRPSGAYQYDIAMGDVDNDGFDEVLVVGVIEGALAAERKGKVWIFDDKAGSYTLLHSVDLVGEFDAQEGNVGLDRVAITSGNLDDDVAIETVVVYYLGGRPSASVLILDDGENNYDELKHDMVGEELAIPTAAVSSEVQRYLRVDTGDSDRDGRDEILVAWMKLDDIGKPSDEYHGMFWLLDDKQFDFSVIDERSTMHGEYFTGFDESDLIAEAKLIDFDGDRMAEIFIMGKILHLYTGTEGNPIEPYYLDIVENQHRCGTTENDSMLLGHSISVGDINGDMRDDLVIYGTNPSIKVIGCEEIPHYNPDTGELESVSNAFESIDSRGPYGAYNENAIVVATNVDQDSLIVQYGGDVPEYTATPDPAEPIPMIHEEHTVYFGDNRLIAVVAAPPCADGIGQNLEGCSTGFGTTIGAGLSTGFTVSKRVGALVGVEEEIQGGFVFASVTLQKFEVEITAELELSAHIESTIEISRTVTDYTVYGEDIVIFSTTPYDRYTYQVVSHSDEVADGKLITVDIPQRPKILTATREYYNSHNGEQMDIGPSILQHVPGQLDTYPRGNEVQSHFNLPNLMLGFVGPFTVNVGHASKESQLELATELGVGAELTLNVDSMVKVCGATICGGVTEGFSLGSSIGMSLSTATTFISEVGAIDAENYPIYNYDYGMFAYTQLAYDPVGKIMQNFIVVNHWVD